MSVAPGPKTIRIRRFSQREHRTEMVNVRFTKTERARLERRAQHFGYPSLSDYIRTVLQRVSAQPEPQREV